MEKYRPNWYTDLTVDYSYVGFGITTSWDKIGVENQRSGTEFHYPLDPL